MKKVKGALTHTVAQAHKHSHKTRTVLEAVANLFVAIESHLLILSILLVLWSIVDVLDILEVNS